MVNRREFLVTAMATSSMGKLAELTERPLSALVGAAGPAQPSVQYFSVPSDRVKVGGEMGRRIDITVNNNLMVLNVDHDFLQPLRDRTLAEGYIGLGKLIDASVRFSFHTGDERVLAYKRRLVTGLLTTQEADGYIGYLRRQNRVWSLWDISEIAYIVYGLAMDHRFYGESASLRGATRLADYLLAEWSAHPGRAIGGNNDVIFLPLVGLDNALLALSQESGNDQYVNFMRDYHQKVGWNDRIVLGRWGKIAGHAYTYFADAIAMLRLEKLDPDPALYGPSRTALDFLLGGNGMAITGACGDYECWHNTQEGTINLGETCASVYALFWMDELMRREGQALYGDLMERLILNTLFGAQSPDGRHLRYYTALDGPRHYFPADTYCCPNNFRRGIATLADVIYYRAARGVMLNLYTPSSAEVALPDGSNVKLSQETRFPNDGRVSLQVDPSRAARFPLALRIPAWCHNPRVTVNGQTHDSRAVPGSFLTIEREWKPGDQVELDLALSPRWVKGRQAQGGRVALLHGPQIFCLNPARHPELKGIDLRLIVIDPETLEGPLPDDSVRPGGQAFRVKAWKPGQMYPNAKFSYTLSLTEFPDPGGEATFFKVPNPQDSRWVDDELMARG